MNLKYLIHHNFDSPSSCRNHQNQIQAMAHKAIPKIQILSMDSNLNTKNSNYR